jgi:hypothetical protein
MKEWLFKDLFGNAVLFWDTGFVLNDERILLDNLELKLWTLLRLYDKSDATVYLDACLAEKYDATILVHENDHCFMFVSPKCLEDIDISTIKVLLVPKKTRAPKLTSVTIDPILHSKSAKIKISIIPKGMKEFLFDANGEIVLPPKEFAFSCFALNKENAVKKYRKSNS